MISVKRFADLSNKVVYSLPHVNTPQVVMLENAASMTIAPESQVMLNKHFENVKASPLNIGGKGVIFGTYDNLHIGHQTVLRTAASLCDNLYIGIEDQEKALIRKNHKHPILDNTTRLETIRRFGITVADNIFIRSTAKNTLESFAANGIEISTLILGESQNDNPEMIEALDYALKNNIQAVVVPVCKHRMANRKYLQHSFTNQKRLAITTL